MHKLSVALRLLAALSLLAIPLWLLLGVRQVERLPRDFRYDAELLSHDNFYDDATAAFSGAVETRATFGYEAVGEGGGALLIENHFEARKVDGTPIVRIAREYAINPATGAHVPTAGDQPRDGYLFAPKNLVRNQGFTYWHVNYDGPAYMSYAGEEDILGLHVYRYETRYQGVKIDQTENLRGVLPEVGVTRGVQLDPYLRIWVEPRTGRLVKYQDITTAYYYDLATGERLTPWNRFDNQFTDAAIAQQVEFAQQERLRSLLMSLGVPAGLVALAALSLLCLALTNPPSSRRLSRLMPFGALALCLLGTFFAWRATRNVLEQRVGVEFNAQAASIQSAITARMGIYANALRGVRGLFDASEEVERAEWAGYARSTGLQQNFPGIQAIGFAPMVTSEELGSFVERVRTEGFQDFAVRPVGQRPSYTPVNFIEPFDAANERAFGYDLSSEPVRLTAMTRALDLNTVAASGKVTLIQDGPGADGSGFVMFLPVYKKGVPLTTLTERRAAVKGYVYAAFRMDDLMAGAVTTQDFNVDFQIFDNDGASPLVDSELLYDNPRGVDDPTYVPAYTQANTIRVNGHPWTIRYRSLPGYGTGGTRSLYADAALGGGLVVSLLIFLILWSFSRSQAQAARLAERMTEELRAKTASLQEVLARDAAIVESIGDGVAVADTEGKFIIFNGAAKRIAGAEKSVGGPENWTKDFQLFLTDGVTPFPTEKNPLLLALQGKPTDGVEELIRRRDGTDVIIKATARPVLDAKGKVVAGVVVFHDTTKEKEIDRAKTEFVSLASHQLRTPLTAIGWYAEMLLSGDAGKISPEQTKFLQEILNGNRRMVDLVNSLLNVSRLELGTFAVEPTPTDVIDMAKSVIAEQQPSIATRRIQFAQKLASDVPVMPADQKLLRMVLQNLLSNAIKYTPEGGSVSMSVGLDEARRNLLVTVADTGYGIPKAQQAKIFGKLFRADNVKRMDTEGTGLGLYIVKSIIDQSGGKIWFTSEEGKGTTFYVALPLSGMRRKEGTKSLS